MCLYSSSVIFIYFPIDFSLLSFILISSTSFSLIIINLIVWSPYEFLPSIIQYSPFLFLLFILRGKSHELIEISSFIKIRVSILAN